MDAVVGIFHYFLADDREVRLLHKDNFRLESISHLPSTDTYAMSVRHERGTVRLSTSKSNIRPTNHVSGGDSLDQLPDWVRDGSSRLVYQSASLAYDEEGDHIGIGSYGIDLLDIEQKKVETLLDDDETDFLAPKMDKSGRLFFVKRPYKMFRGHQPSTKELLKDIVLFPYRLARTFVYIANFLSTFSSGKPIANSLDLNPMENRQRFHNLWGHMLDTQEVLKKKKNDKYPAMVPADWELAMKDGDQSLRVLANHVVCFDITNDGDVVYSNGSRIWFLDGDADRELSKGSSIFSLAVI